MNEKIYIFLQKIPKGKVISYKALAEYFSTSARAIGKIMSGNTHPEIFPCYKVVKSNGELWWYNWGIEEKIKRLIADWIIIIKGIIPAKDFRYPPQLKTKKK